MAIVEMGRERGREGRVCLVLVVASGIERGRDVSLLGAGGGGGGDKGRHLPHLFRAAAKSKCN